MSHIAVSLGIRLQALSAIGATLFACSSGSGGGAATTTDSSGGSTVVSSGTGGAGQQASGGQDSLGGNLGTGGAGSSQGGQSTVGGGATTGGTSSSSGGSQSTGGIEATGGASLGGQQSTGGLGATGGVSSSQGGQAPTGGNTGSGGSSSSSQGGQQSTGGSLGVGGGASGGSSGQCPVPPAPQPGGDSVTFLSGVTVSTLVGGPDAGTANGDAATARFSNPVSIARLTDSSLVVSDYDSALIRKVESVTGAVTTVTAIGSNAQPYGLAVLNGVVFAHTDRNSLGEKSSLTGTIWSIDSTTGTPTVQAENLGRPRALAGLGSNQLLLADDVHQVVLKFDLNSKAIDLITGIRDCRGFVDGNNSEALFNKPTGIVVRSDGAFIVADSGNARVRVITTDGTVSTLAGDGVAATVDGPANTARFVSPRAIAIDASDNLYISDDGAHRIRRIDKNGVTVTIAGAGGTINDFADGSGETAKFAGQEGIAVSSDGKTLYVADGNGGSEDPAQLNFHRIRAIALP